MGDEYYVLTRNSSLFDGIKHMLPDEFKNGYIDAIIHRDYTTANRLIEDLIKKLNMKIRVKSLSSFPLDKKKQFPLPHNEEYIAFVVGAYERPFSYLGASLLCASSGFS